MHLFDPERPKLANGRPLVLGQQFTVPNLLVQPIEDNQFRVMIMLPGTGTGFCWHNCVIDCVLLGMVFTEYTNDPEATFVSRFNYRPVSRLVLDQHYIPLSERQAAEPKRSAPATPPPGFVAPDLSDLI